MKQTHDNLLVLDATTLTTLEHWRDQMAERVARLANECDPHIVEGFYYADTERASKVRGRLGCSLLRSIDHVNKRICAIVAPEFAPRPSESFSDRVMQEIAS